MKEKIMQAASARFARYGFEKTTLEEIAGDLNKVKSSIYYYFKTKEALFEAVMETEIKKLAVIVKKNIAMQKTPKEKLRSFITSHLQAFETITDGYWAIFDLYFSTHRIVLNARKVYDEREMQLIGELLSEGNKQGEFAVKNIKLTSSVIMTAIKGAETGVRDKK